VKKLQHFGVTQLADQLGHVSADVAQAGAVVAGDVRMGMVGVGMLVKRLDAKVAVGGNLDLVAAYGEVIAVVLDRDGRRRGVQGPSPSRWTREYCVPRWTSMSALAAPRQG